MTKSFSQVDDILNLINTRDGDYAAACSMDYAKPPAYYDTFALRDIEGYEAVTSTFPYFRSKISRDAMIAGQPVPVQSCWNGMGMLPFPPLTSTLSPSPSRPIPSPKSSTPQLINTSHQQYPSPPAPFYPPSPSSPPLTFRGIPTASQHSTSRPQNAASSTPTTRSRPPKASGSTPPSASRIPPLRTLLCIPASRGLCWRRRGGACGGIGW